MENEISHIHVPCVATEETAKKPQTSPHGPAHPRHARQWQRKRPGYSFPRQQSALSIAASESVPIIPRAVGIRHAPPVVDSDWSQNHAADHHVRGEQALWRAVILQALTDAACESRKYESKILRDKARQWLLAAGQDFRDVCDYAGFDPDRVKRHVRKALPGGCQWRMAPKDGSQAFQRR